MNPPLYNRQKEVFNFIERFIEQNGYSPTLTQIRDAMEVKALSTVHWHLAQLEDKGYIKRDPESKGIDLIIDTGKYVGNIINVPLIGEIAAGEPILAYQQNDMDVPIPQNLVGNKRVFCLKVRGDSMIESLIADGDIVVIEQVDYANNGDTVVALLDDGSEERVATLKKYYKEKDSHGRQYVRLQPANEKYKAKIIDNADAITIQGKVIAIYRHFSQ